MVISPVVYKSLDVCPEGVQSACQGACAVADRGARLATVVFSSENVSGSRRLRRTRHGSRCRAATVTPALIVLLISWLPVAGQPIDAPPDRAQVDQAFEMVSGWVRAGKVSKEAQPEDLGPSAVTLRLAGERVGWGQHVGPGALATATRLAIGRARERLGPIAEGERWAGVADQMTISIEIAGPFVPLQQEGIDGQVARLEPGIDGVAIRIGDEMNAIFPGAALTRGMTPRESINSLLSKLTGDPTSAVRSLDDNLERTHAVIYRFRVRHVVQLEPGGVPFPVIRGGRVVRLGQITTESIREMADGIAAHLLRRQSGDGGLPGAYLPTQGRYIAESGTDLNRSLVAFALLRYAHTPGADPALAVDARLRAFELLDSVAQHLDDPDSRSADNPLVAAFVLAAVAEARDSMGGIEGIDVLEELSARAFPAFDAVFDVDRGFVEVDSVSMYGVIALGLASRASLSGDADDLARAEASVRASYAKTEPGKLVSQMPWLLLAEQRVGALTGEGVRAVTALRGMRSLIWEHQLIEEPGTPADLVGGIVFTTRAGVRPDWTSLRAISAAAGMLGDPTLTDDDEMLAEVARLVRSLRFLRQLCADEVVGHMYVDPGHAKWGVRSSCWTHRMPADASALGLLAVCDSLDSMGRIEARQAADRP